MPAGAGPPLVGPPPGAALDLRTGEAADTIDARAAPRSKLMIRLISNIALLVIIIIIIIIIIIVIIIVIIIIILLIIIWMKFTRFSF